MSVCLYTQCRSVTTATNNQYLLLSSLLCQQKREPIKRPPVITMMIVARVYKRQSNDPLLSGPFTWCYWNSCAVPDADVLSLTLTKFTNIHMRLLTPTWCYRHSLCINKHWFGPFNSCTSRCYWTQRGSVQLMQMTTRAVFYHTQACGITT